MTAQNYSQPMKANPTIENQGAAVSVGSDRLLACPVCGGVARRGKHNAVECENYCTRSAMRPTWAECVADWNSPDFRPNCGPFTRADLQANKAINPNCTE